MFDHFTKSPLGFKSGSGRYVLLTQISQRGRVGGRRHPRRPIAASVLTCQPVRLATSLSQLAGVYGCGATTGADTRSSGTRTRVFGSNGGSCCSSRARMHSNTGTFWRVSRQSAHPHPNVPAPRLISFWSNARMSAVVMGADVIYCSPGGSGEGVRNRKIKSGRASFARGGCPLDVL